MSQLASDLENKTFDFSHSLLADYYKYGSDNFVFIIYALGKEWEDSEKRDQELKKNKRVLGWSTLSRRSFIEKSKSHCLI